MSQKLLVAIFKEIEDAQTAINELSESGFLQEVSLITKNENEEPEPEENNEDYSSELDGEGMEEVRGLIDPIATGEFGTVEVVVPNVGDMIFAGPIGNIVEEEDLESDFEDEVTQEGRPEIEFDKILEKLGLKLEDTTFIENYMKENYVLIAVPIDEENEEEVNTILSDSGAELIEETKAEW